MHPDSHTPPLSLAQFTKNGGLTQEQTREEQCKTATPWIATASEVTGLYIHVPFCFHKCHYCDFFSIVGDASYQQQFVNQLTTEFQIASTHISQPIQSIFIGGGTPTLLEPSLLSMMLKSINSNFTLDATCEWTIEVNPETVTSELALILMDAGVNRVSIGVQTFNEVRLKALERLHKPSSVYRSVDHFRAVGFENINLDLIFAIPGQTLAMAEDDLRKAIELEPAHISSYALTYEPQTPLYTREKRGEVEKVNEEVEARMFEQTMRILADAKYEQYEISNYCQPGKECRHNLNYWNNGAWWPFGPAAAGHVAGRRWRNVPRLSQYCQADGLPPVEDVELLSENSRVGETFMLGLRLLRGIPKQKVLALLTQEGGDNRHALIKQHMEAGLLEWSPDLRLTKKGLMLADTVMGDLLMARTPMVDTKK